MSDVWDWTCKTWRGGSTSSLHRIETDSVRQTQCASQLPFRAQALKAQLISALLQLFVEKTTAGRRFDYLSYALLARVRTCLARLL